MSIADDALARDLFWTALGEGERKVRSLIEPELACLRTPGGLAAPPDVPDAVEPFLCMRLVCTLPTGTGVVACDRKAAAAAADERSPLEDLLLRKAWLAARAAFGDGVVFCGYKVPSQCCAHERSGKVGRIGETYRA